MGNRNGIKLKLFGESVLSTRTKNQTLYVEKILSEHITFGLGVAGTGKTYCAVGAALHLLAEKQIEKIFITRPAVEAGEKLGSLPGDSFEKLEPYLLPVFDSFVKFLDKNKLKQFLEKGIIEVAPLAYMRGRTFDDCVVIVDEGQNITKMQMKMILTRIGKNGKIIVNGDPYQCDLPPKTISGLGDAVKRLKDKKGIGVVRFDESDVVRHPIVKTIIQAYENDY